MSGIAILRVVGYLLLAPIAGGLLTGLDRIFRARIYGRKAPAPLQPFLEVLLLIKLVPLQEDKKIAKFSIAYMIISAISGTFFIYGGNLILVILLSVLAGSMYLVGIYISRSSYAKVNLEKGILWLGFYLTLFLLSSIGFYLLTALSTGEGSFNVAGIVSLGGAPAYYLPGLLVGVVAFLIIAPRNSFLDDTVAAEYSGRNLALLEIGRWFETILLLSFVFLFNYGGSALSLVIALVVCLLVYALRLFLTVPLPVKISPIIQYTIGLIVIILAFVNIICILA